MALADLVLEGLTLILVIALGAVLIGGLTYLSTTVASANGARLVGMGTYVYVPAAVYLNGTLYVPMYNIGHYTVVVRQIFIRVGNTLISQTLNTTLAPGQYYLYTTTLNQGPTAVTVVASPTVEPRLKLEFSANATEPGQITLMPMSTNTGGNGLIEVVVNDPYGAGWVVAWSYAGQSYSMAKSTTYTWYINPPYLPIQITFNAQVTSNPSDYTCQIQPNQATNTYGPGSVQTFVVACTNSTNGGNHGGGGDSGGGGGGYFVFVTVTNDTLGAQWVVSSSVDFINGSGDVNNAELAIGGPTDTLYASITTSPSGYSCSISPNEAPASPGVHYVFTVDCVASSGTTPQPPQPNYCVVYPGATDNVGGASGAYVSPSTTQEVPVGSSVLFTWGISNNPVGGYYFDHWVIELNGEVVGTSTFSGASYTFTCNAPGNYSLVGEAIYMPRYLKVGGGDTLNPPGNGTYPLSQVTTAYFEWSDPQFISGTWTASTDPAGDSLTLSVTLTDAYSAEGTAPQLQASTTLTLQSPPSMACYMGSISESGSITSATASNWLPPITIQVMCYLTNGRST